MALCYSSSMTQSTLVETRRHNLQTFLLAQTAEAKCRTWKQLVVQGEQAKEIFARIRAEEKDCKTRPDKSMRHAPESSSQPRRRDTLATEVKSPSKAQSVKEGMASSQPCANKSFSLRISTWYLCSSYSKRATNSNF